jgi:hypothetical protein
MRHSITIEVNSSDFEEQNNFIFLQMNVVFNKYNYSVINDRQELRLEYLARELSLLNDKTVVCNACYNLEEINYLIKELKTFNISLEVVYIPSNNRIDKRKAQALENVNLHGRWIGSSEREVEESFKNFRITLQEIKDGLKETCIHVIEM